MRVVLDTNVIVSSYLSSVGIPAGIRTALEQRRFDLIASRPLLDEYRRALAYPGVAVRHGMDADQIGKQVDGLRRIAMLVDIHDVPNVIPEAPEDNMVIATAVAGNALYIVSGDNDLHRLGEFRGIQILTPAQFFALLSA